MFGIPSFGNIVDLLYDWNTRELPLIGRPSKTGGVPGIFAELKHSQFFQEDGNISIADLFLDELASHPKASDLLFDHIKLCDNLKYDEYRVPPLVVHSFEADVLEYLRTKFKERWMDFVEEDEIFASGVVTNSTEEDDEIAHPWIPPLILLVKSSYCHSTEFWFEVAGLHISGLGIDKGCLLPPSDIASTDVSAIRRAKREAREWVVKAHSERLAVFLWTLRPEIESDVPKIFSSGKEEMRYYFCELNVDGAWAEDIASALSVGVEGCDGKSSTAEEGKPQVGEAGPQCSERNQWLLSLSSLAIGVFIGAVASCFVATATARKGYYIGANGANPVRALPVADTAIEGHDDENTII
ncbi:hypothetical protein ACHAWF_006224 [Thalassiosira exigua]